MPIKIAINGFGRIGRPTFRRILKNHPDLEVAAINDLAGAETLAHLLKYDTIYGIYEKSVKFSKDSLLVDGTLDGNRVQVLAVPEPEKLPWKDLGVDIVLECTGRFRELGEAQKHLRAGAKQVIISAPAKSRGVDSFILGINEQSFDPEKNKVCDMSSCTTNCLAPVAKVLHENFKIIKGFITTVHAYTNDQRILDLAHKDLRRARAAALNIIPTTTGATSSIAKVMPQLENKLDGMALRVPTSTVSILELVCQVEKKATVQDVNYIFKKASQQKELEGILGIEDAPLVSSDYIGNSFSAVVDAELTVAKDNLIKVVAWYDNEYAYACRLAEFAEFVGKKLK